MAEVVLGRHIFAALVNHSDHPGASEKVVGGHETVAVADMLEEVGEEVVPRASLHFGSSLGESRVVVEAEDFDLGAVVAVPKDLVVDLQHRSAGKPEEEHLAALALRH